MREAQAQEKLESRVDTARRAIWHTLDESTSITNRRGRNSSLPTALFVTANVHDHAACLWKYSSSGRTYTMADSPVARGILFCNNVLMIIIRSSQGTINYRRTYVIKELQLKDKVACHHLPGNPGA